MLQVKDLKLAYGENVIAQNISFDLKKGELGCLLGGSGSGKSTLLRAIAGFQANDTGSIIIRSQVMQSPEKVTAPEDRHIGMVFQDFALFPHLTVQQNIVFGIKAKSKEHKHRRTTELLELIGLSGFENRYPHELSGGQQQRIALARALAPEPDLILLDEPFSSLDTELRYELAHQVKTILQSQQVTALMVTHDQSEAFAFADKIGILNHGQLLQWGTANELYCHPKTIEVAQFIGRGVFVSCTVDKELQVSSCLGQLRANPNHSLQTSEGRLLLRPEHISIDEQSHLRATIRSVEFKGAEQLLKLVFKAQDGQELNLLSRVSNQRDMQVGTEVGIVINTDLVSVF